MMSLKERIITIIMLIIGTSLTRFIPFILFPPERETPKFIIYLGRVLPAAVIGMLVIYSLKDVSLSQHSHGLPELIAIVIVTGLHLWKRQMLLSIAAGTISYMLLVQLVF